jgi:hypothetical protein
MFLNTNILMRNRIVSAEIIKEKKFLPKEAPLSIFGPFQYIIIVHLFCYQLHFLQTLLEYYYLSFTNITIIAAQYKKIEKTTKKL